jgi:LacI family transcriptional regulator
MGISAVPVPRPTLRDVARAAGVSPMTVSRVVSGKASVAEPTRARVLAAIQDLGYRRNHIARSLRPGHSSALLGLVITNVANPFYSVIADAAERAARQRGFRLIMTSTDEDPARERELVEDLLSRQVDGLLVVPVDADASFLAAERDGATKVVFLGRPPQRAPADVVLVDDFGGARAGVTQLIAEGHRRIGFISNQPRVYTAAERLRGFLAACQDAAMPVDERLLRSGCQDAGAAEVAAGELLALPDPPTALFTANNRNTVGALRAIRAARRQVALVGFDDFDLADMIELPFRVVAYDAHEMGRLATNLLIERIAGERHPPRRLVVPTCLQWRGTPLSAP